MSRAQQEFNARVVEEYRTNAGRVESLKHLQLLLLHHKGASTGELHVTPLACLVDGERYVVFASKNGAPSDPQWYRNIIANPEVTIEVGTQTLDMVAVEAHGEERDRLFSTQITHVPEFAEYEPKAGRVIPVVILRPHRS